MALKISVDIPEIGNVENKEDLQTFVTATRQALQEVIAKAQQVQDTLVTAAPAATDFEISNQAIPYDNGVTRRLYYYINGALRYASLT